MALAGLLQQSAIIPAMKANSKKQLLQELATKAAKITGIPEREIFDVILQRERLGSTGVGNGIAIPHCRLSGCSSPLCAVLHLEAAVDFDAIDGAPVDLLFVLLVPEAATDEHLELLRQIASMLDRADIRERLRQASDSQALYQIVVDAQNGL